jgi:PIN domain nuclease of toxin-antitoxin system
VTYVLDACAVIALINRENGYDEVLVKICSALDCDTSDIMEFDHDDNSVERGMNE